MSGTLLFSEILDIVHKAKTKDQKVKILREHNSDALRMIIKSSFDPKVVWDVPAGSVPFKKNGAPAGTEHSVLAYESRKLWHFIKGADNVTVQYKKEQMFIQMLEGLHESEADVLVAAKDKRLHQVYKGLSEPVVIEAFGWTENFTTPEVPVYPQGSASASGISE